MLTRIDLRGLTCPEPVLKVKKIMDDPQVTQVEALVDDDVCVNNLQRLARSLKATAAAKEENGYCIVTIELTKTTGLQPLVSQTHQTPALMPGCTEECGGGGNPRRTDLKNPAGNAEVSLEPEEMTSQVKQVGTVIFLAKDTFGDGDPELSKTLVNLFLQTILEAGHQVRAILMANSGVKLMAKDSPVFKVLEDFAARGSEVLACGLCLEFYGLKEQVPKDQITNMFVICEYLFAADKVLSL